MLLAMVGVEWGVGGNYQSATYVTTEVIPILSNFWKLDKNVQVLNSNVFV